MTFFGLIEISYCWIREHFSDPSPPPPLLFGLPRLLVFRLSVGPPPSPFITPPPPPNIWNWRVFAKSIGEERGELFCFYLLLLLSYFYFVFMFCYFVITFCKTLFSQDIFRVISSTFSKKTDRCYKWFRKRFCLFFQLVF